MRKNTQSQLAIILFAACTSSSPLHAQSESGENAPMAEARTIKSTNSQPLESNSNPTLAEANARISKIEQDISNFRWHLSWGLTLGSFGIAVLSFFGWESIKGKIKRFVDRNLNTQITSALHLQLPERLADVQARAEGYLLRFARLLTLHGLGHFDEALKAYGWDGNISSLRSESLPIRRLIIECLHSSREDRRAKRQLALEALNELIIDDNSIECMRLFLRINYASRRIKEGVAFVDKHREQLATDRESALRASTLLRKANRQEDALKLVKAVYDERDLECVVHSAVLERDLGNFNEAHDVLTPAVTQLISDPKTQLPDGWHRILNTFIANCIDRNRPEDGLRSAEFVFRSSPGAVEVFTVGRLIKALPESNQDRSELMSRFAAAIEGLAAGEARLRCEVLHLQMQKNFDVAEKLLLKAIEPRSAAGKNELDSDTYYQYCTLGEFYIDQKRPDDAIDVLMTAAGSNYGGEAKFYLAIAYATKGEDRDSGRWLSQALQELPKWAAHARDHEVLRNSPSVAEVLAIHARTRQT